MNVQDGMKTYHPVYFSIKMYNLVGFFTTFFVDFCEKVGLALRRYIYPSKG